MIERSRRLTADMARRILMGAQGPPQMVTFGDPSEHLAAGKAPKRFLRPREVNFNGRTITRRFDANDFFSSEVKRPRS